jgi:hypothetical protein
MYNGSLIKLLNDIDILADEVVEEELTPEECCLKLKKIIENYNVKKSPKQMQVLNCIDDLASLCNVIISEQSTPDVIQEYLFYIIDHYHKYTFKKIIIGP